MYSCGILQVKSVLRLVVMMRLFILFWSFPQPRLARPLKAHRGLLPCRPARLAAERPLFLTAAKQLL